MSASLHVPDFFNSVPEQKKVICTDFFANLDVCPVESPDRESAVHRKFHVAGAGRFHTGCRDLFAQVCRRNDDLCE